MRKVLFGLMMFLAVCTLAKAEVNYTPLMETVDGNGNKILITEYDIDGKVVESRYVCKDGVVYSAKGAKLFTYENGILDGRSIQISAYAITNFVGMTQDEINSYVDSKEQDHAKSLIIDVYKKKENENIDLSGLVGVKKTVTTADIMVSETEKWTVDTAGNKTVSVVEKEDIVTLEDKIDALSEKVESLNTSKISEISEVSVEK